MSSARDLHNSERLLTIVKQIITWHDKWKTAQARGNSLCQSIEVIKRRAFDQKEKDKNTVSLYPDELQQVCDSLAIVTTIFEDAVNALALFERQLIAVAGTEKGGYGGQRSPNVVFKTWMMNDLLDCVSFIHNAFRQEYQIKKTISENIAHATSKEEVVWHTAIWSYPMAASNVQLDAKVMSLSVEIS